MVREAKDKMKGRGWLGSLLDIHRKGKAAQGQGRAGRDREDRLRSGCLNNFLEDV